MARKLPGGAADGPGIDAAVRAETLVLEVDQHGEIAPIDLSGLDGEAPAAVAGGVGTQEATVAIEHRDGKVVGDGKRWQCKQPPAGRGCEEGKHDNCASACRAARR